jgi:transcriptional regulator with XRE-family HTH domain
MQTKANAPASDPAHAYSSENELELAIGRQVQRYRKQLGLSIAKLGEATGLSVGMVSKIENGNTSPSLATLKSVSRVLNVPLTSLFREFEQQHDAVHVKSGAGLTIERRGTRAGHQYQLLGHNIRGEVTVEPYLITLTEESEVFPLFQHAGIEFLYLLTGSMVYRYGNSTYHMEPGDSLFFDSDVTHGPEELVDLPIRFLAVISSTTT